MKRITVIVMALVSCAAMYAQGRALYVSPQGDDSSSGTAEAPLRTFGAAVSMASVQKADTVWFMGGVYEIGEGITIEGLSDVVFAAVPGEEPVFRGSRSLTSWKKVKDRSVLSKVAPSARKGLVVTELCGLDAGQLGDPVKKGSRPELFLNGELQTLARWPDCGFTKGGRALGSTIIPPVENGNSGAREGIFEYLDERIGRWAEEDMPCVAGYWFWDWDDDCQKVKAIDTEKHSITLTKNRPCRHGNRFYGLNLLCELDTPGEWYLDRSSSRLYWLPPTGTDPVKHPEGITLSMLSAKAMLTIRDCRSVVLDGLTFAETRGDGINIIGGEGCRIENCRIENTGTNGIIIDGGASHAIEGCVIRHLGCKGIHVTAGDRRALVSSDIEISNNLVADFARFKRTYNEGIGTDGCGIHLHHNELHTSPSSAFALGGNDVVAEFNHIHNVCQESDDQGGFDLYLDPSMRGIVMRYNRWSDIVGGTRYGVAAIRLDDLITGVSMYGNVFERCGSVEFGAIQVHGGSENVIEDNLFYKCPMAVSFTNYSDSLWHETHKVISKMLYEDINILSPQYLLRYPEIREFGKNIDVNIIRSNLLVGCDSLFFRDGGVQISSGNIMVEDDGRSVEELCKSVNLHPLGIRAIPVEEMGIKKNKWLGIQ
ncbi:MAG: right-handed parallel beta-helix repeat-containing protein [Bacteroidales bacterium]|nr:right-handed parallel beta-helix repeat-containing protein [Bacteroidales bacterium]